MLGEFEDTVTIGVSLFDLAVARNVVLVRRPDTGREVVDLKQTARIVVGPADVLAACAVFADEKSRNFIRWSGFRFSLQNALKLQQLVS